MFCSKLKQLSKEEIELVLFPIRYLINDDNLCNIDFIKCQDNGCQCNGNGIIYVQRFLNGNYYKSHCRFVGYYDIDGIKIPKKGKLLTIEEFKDPDIIRFFATVVGKETRKINEKFTRSKTEMMIAAVEMNALVDAVTDEYLLERDVVLLKALLTNVSETDDFDEVCWLLDVIHEIVHNKIQGNKDVLEAFDRFTIKTHDGFGNPLVTEEEDDDEEKENKA